MALFSFLRAHTKESTMLVLHVDVGQGNCRGALLRHGHKREMVFSSGGVGKIVHGVHGKSVSVTLASLAEILSDVSKFLLDEKKSGLKIKVGSIYVILAAPYYLSHTATIKYRDDAGFVVTPKLVSDLIEGYKKADDEHIKDHEDAKVGEEPQVIGERVIHCKINGYHTTNPYGKRAKSLEINAFRTEVDDEVVNGISREIKKVFQVPISFEPLSLAVYIALRNHVHFDQDFIFVIVGNEVSEISLVKGYTLVETVSFPFGKHSLMRHLSRELKTPDELVSEDVSLYVRNSMNATEKTKFSIALDSGGKGWFSFLEKALVSLSNESAVPPVVYLVSDNDVQPLFKRFIETDSYAHQALVPNGFSVIPIDSELAKTLMDFGIHASCDTLLCLEGLFALSTKLPIQNH